eukprot:5162290-Amphidinium_carterae.1
MIDRVGEYSIFITPASKFRGGLAFLVHSRNGIYVVEHYADLQRVARAARLTISANAIRSSTFMPPLLRLLRQITRTLHLNLSSPVIGSNAISVCPIQTWLVIGVQCLFSLSNTAFLS